MEEFFVAFGGYETDILLMFLGAAFNILVALGIFFWIRRLLRAWAKRTQVQVDQQIVTITEHFLLPILALAAAYGLYSLGVMPKGFGIGKKVFLGAIIVLALWLAARLCMLFLERQAQLHEIARVLTQRLQGPIWVTIAATVFLLLAYLLAPDTPALLALPKIILILSLTWLSWRVVSSGAQMLSAAYVQRLEDVDPARARSSETLIGVLRHVTQFAVVLIATVAVLDQFAFFQTLARSILASAGIAGLVIGLAAQRPLGNLFAGIQLALTQPIRIGDSVIFEHDWGWIEEITLSYVVIRIWDLRRLVVPISYLVDRPIQNWTKTSPDLIGTVYIYTDYRIDVEAVRQELGKILESTPLWNRKVPPVLHVTDCKEQTVELRVLCSASSAPGAWELRCLVREKLLNYIQEIENGRFLPRTRVEFERQAIASA
ncbi:MAG: mechanosensitive ion channel family protein [Candidatus Methylomirabilales bacterium]